MSSERSSSRYAYPHARRTPHVDRYHDHMVPDPYVYLEEPDHEETKKFVEQQNQLFTDYLSTIQSERSKAHHRLRQLFDYKRYSSPVFRPNGLFYYRNDGLQDHAVLYKINHSDDNSNDNEARLILDPNQLSDDHLASVGSYAISECGKQLAYGVARGGSDWQTIEVKNSEDGVVEEHKLEWVKFGSIAFTHDSRGFFYSRYPTPKEFAQGDSDFKRGTETSALEYQQLYYHRLGTPQSCDVLVWGDTEHPKWMFGAEVTDDGLYLLITVSESTDPVNQLYFTRLEDDGSYRRQEQIPDDQLIKVVAHFKHEYSYVTNIGNKFYFKTNRHAPKYRIISAVLDENCATETEERDLSERWSEVLGQADDVITSAAVCNQTALVIVYMHDAHELLYVHDLNSGQRLHQISLPDIGSIASLSCRKKDDHFFYQFTSFTNPGLIMKVRLNNLQNVIESTIFRHSQLSSYDPSLYETKQLFYPSKDGTSIPIFIICRKDFKPSGDSPLWLYGYGGFNISLSPSFAVSRAFWLQHFNNSVYVIANIRGGGERGEDWHKAGTKLKKQNCFDDFQSAARYLIEHRYTDSKHLVINGGSNGGLLVGACVNQSPELFGCAVAAVGVMDMLKFHLKTIGWAWTSDYGCSDNKEDFDNLMKYSPLHTIPVDKTLPAVLVTTGDHDDRVVPMHSLKYIAELQYRVGAKSDQVQPLLARIQTKAGHGAGASLTQRIDELADVFAFVSKAIDQPMHFE